LVNFPRPEYSENTDSILKNQPLQSEINMISKAKAKFIRVSPRKAREVIDLIRGKKVGEALGILENINKRARKPIIKVLKSAISNSKQSTTDESRLYISKIVADKGPILKRHRAAAFGRAVSIRHRLCHLTVELDEVKKEIKPKTKKLGAKKKEIKPKTKKTEVKKRKKIKKSK